MGKKSQYELKVKPYLADITRWLDVLTEEEIAEKLGVSDRTFLRYKKEFPELQEAIDDSKENLIKELKLSLKKAAKGYYYEEVETITEHDPDDDTEWIPRIRTQRKFAKPDVVAANMLLKNLDETWRQDDYITTQLRKKQVELQEKKIDLDSW